MCSDAQELVQCSAHLPAGADLVPKSTAAAGRAFVDRHRPVSAVVHTIAFSGMPCDAWLVSGPHLQSAAALCHVFALLSRSMCSADSSPQSCDGCRYLNLFRGIIPPLGGTIDLSPILAFITLDVSNAELACRSVKRVEWPTCRLRSRSIVVLGWVERKACCPVAGVHQLCTSAAV
jgi:YGGT family